MKNFWKGFEKQAISNDWAQERQAGGILSRMGKKNTSKNREAVLEGLADVEHKNKSTLRVRPSGYKGIDYESFVRDYQGPTGVKNRGIKLKDWRPLEGGVHPTDVARSWAKKMPKGDPAKAVKFMKKVIGK